jgi:Phosphatidylethanolamine-binding protein
MRGSIYSVKPSQSAFYSADGHAFSAILMGRKLLTTALEDSRDSKYDRNAAQFPQWAAFLMLLAAAQISCSRGVSKPSLPSLELRSSSFAGDAIPSKYQGSPENSPCNGKDISPELSWNSAPQRTQSFALIVTDKDSPLWFDFVHWVLYDLPADKRELPGGHRKAGRATGRFAPRAERL